jgi:hypothetical protein
MPFKEINISEEIEKQCRQDSEFKAAWEASRKEYDTICKQISAEKCLNDHLEE